MHHVAFRKILGFADARSKGHKVEAILGKQGGVPLRVPDPDVHRDHAPTVGHDSGDRFQVAALLVWNGDKEPWGRSLPDKNFAAELEVH